MTGTEDDSKTSAEPWPAEPTGEVLKGRVAKAFSTPIGAYLWPESDALNAALTEQIRARKDQTAGQTRSNVGGWHSDGDLTEWGGEAVAVLRQRMLRMAAEVTGQTLRGAQQTRVNFAVSAWANVSRDGNYNAVHAHSGAHWSGVYYVASGEPVGDNPRNGLIEFIDPRGGAAMLRPPAGTFEETQMVAPRPGLMLIFPGWLKHFVHPFQGRGERISIAFNVTLGPAR